MRRSLLLKPPRSLYVHLPFCRSKCRYCDFYSIAIGPSSDSVIDAYVDALLSRLDERMDECFYPYEDAGFDTVYVGGGTPTALPRSSLERLFVGLAARVGRPREWTVEANPESLDEAAVAIFLKSGVTRLSLGVQSLDDGLLASLGRPAGSEACERALGLALGSGSFSVSADLMAGLPRRRPLVEEVERLADSGIGHLSIYDLVLEDGTELASRVASGAFVLPDQDEAASEREEADAALGSLGFHRYEISNYARPGSESLHNLAYWRMDPYLGVGASAVSTLQLRADESGQGRGASIRIEETASVQGFLEGVLGKTPPAEARIGPVDSAFEAIMMAFRTCYGLDMAAFKERFGVEAGAFVGGAFARWKDRLAPSPPWPRLNREDGKVEEGAGMALDAKGMNILNRFLVDCLAEIDNSRLDSGAFLSD